MEAAKVWCATILLLEYFGDVVATTGSGRRNVCFEKRGHSQQYPTYICHDRSLSRRFVRSDRSSLSEGRLKVVIAWFCIQVVIKDSKDHLLNQVTIWELWDCNSYPPPQPPPPKKKKSCERWKKVCGIICGSWFYVFNETCGNKKKTYLKDTVAMRLLVCVWVFDQGVVQKCLVNKPQSVISKHICCFVFYMDIGNYMIN